MKIEAGRWYRMRDPAFQSVGPMRWDEQNQVWRSGRGPCESGDGWLPDGRRLGASGDSPFDIVEMLPFREPPDSPYTTLRSILDDAFAQASEGNGKDRHANGRPFDSQPIMEIGRMVGPGGHAYQVAKKVQEAVGMASRGEYAAARAECLGAIVYAAAMARLIDEMAGEVAL